MKQKTRREIFQRWVEVPIRRACDLEMDDAECGRFCYITGEPCKYDNITNCEMYWENEAVRGKK